MMYSLNQYGCLAITGPDAKKFLQGQLTCNLDMLGPSQSMMGALCNPKGRIISLFHICYHHDHYLLLMPREMVPLTESALRKYAPFFKVSCIDSSNEYHFYGTTSKRLLNQANDDSLFIPLNDDLAIIMTTLKDVDAVSGDTTTWPQLMINEKIPTLIPSLSQRFLPHELNLDAFNAIAFDKGCYTGQEIIARMHYRSQVRYHLAKTTAQSTAAIQAGVDVLTTHEQTEKAIGSVVNVTEITPHTYHLLITVKEQFFNSEPIFIKSNDSEKIMLSLE